MECFIPYFVKIKRASARNYFPEGQGASAQFKVHPSQCADTNLIPGIYIWRTSSWAPLGGPYTSPTQILAIHWLVFFLSIYSQNRSQSIALSRPLIPPESSEHTARLWNQSASSNRPGLELPLPDMLESLEARQPATPEPNSFGYWGRWLSSHLLFLFFSLLSSPPLSPSFPFPSFLGVTSYGAQLLVLCCLWGPYGMLDQVCAGQTPYLLC